MSFSHTNNVRYYYTAGGSTTSVSVSKSETAGGEMNVSETVVLTDASTADVDISDFEFATAAGAKSVYLLAEGANVSLWANGSSAGTKMADLDDGIPYVWSYNGAVNFPPGQTNPMVSSTAKLSVKPDSAPAGDTNLTLTVRVLYDVTP